jgi:hypothetical protein
VCPEAEEIDAGTSARIAMPPPAADGVPVPAAALEMSALAGSLPPLVIHLDLGELIELNEVVQHQKSGLIKKGQGFAKDPARPAKVLGGVTRLFKGLGNAVRVSLGDGSGSQRFLKAAFTWGMDPDVGGVSAKGISRTKMGPFNRMGDDQSRPVTAYVFEGVVGNWVVEYLGGSCNIDNLLATVVAHELGHQLGLDHSQSTGNTMFNFRDASTADRRRWLETGSKATATFDAGQVRVMLQLLQKS